jgi:Tfp pilus assembly protein PilE
MLRHLKNNLGYTLVEIVTTTAIIGSLTAIAVPNFLRVKMNVNMEMVKQHMKVIGQEMNELYNRTRQFPASAAEIINGASSEELSITASLNAIDNMGYTDAWEGYETDVNRSTYSLTKCPKPGLENIAGDRCFVVDTMGVREMALAVNAPWWDGTGVPPLIFWGAPQGLGLTPWDWNDAPNKILQDPSLSRDQKIQLLADGLTYQAYWMFNYFAEGGAFYPSFFGSTRSDMSHIVQDNAPSYLSTISSTNQQTLQELLPDINKTIFNRGISVVHTSTNVNDSDLNNYLSDSKWYNTCPMCLVSPSTYVRAGTYDQISFRYNPDVVNSGTIKDLKENIRYSPGVTAYWPNVSPGSWNWD